MRIGGTNNISIKSHTLCLIYLFGIIVIDLVEYFFQLPKFDWVQGFKDDILSQNRISKIGLNSLLIDFK